MVWKDPVGGEGLPAFRADPLPLGEQVFQIGYLLSKLPPGVYTFTVTIKDAVERVNVVEVAKHARGR